MSANNIPEKLKAADITRFATRAGQIEKVKPVIWYWCNYWIVNQILSKSLHQADEECLKFTTGLMDALEQFKSQHSNDDTVTDDVAGQAYVEQFSQDTFQRADNAVKANKATLQTADTFQAAATFFELCQIWGQLDPEIAAKIKFAKYHALRIVKAVKAGEDPNKSNPVAENEEGEGSETVLEQGNPSGELPQAPDMPGTRRGRQASVEEIPDDFDRVQHRLAEQSTLDESIHPSRSTSAGPQRQTDGVASPAGEIPSPGFRPAGMMNLDGDLRQRPSHLSQATIPDLPAAPSDFPQGSPASGVATPSNLGAPPNAFPSLDTFHSFPPPAVASDEPQRLQRTPSPSGVDRKPHAAQTSVPTSFPQPAKPTAPPPTSYPPPGSSAHGVDEDAIAQAQKHARWAVSALNFDDVNTAIKELKNALHFLRSH